MELKLQNGQYVPGKYQGFESVSGGEELLQRVLMKLKARRGSFLPEPKFGSRLYLLPGMKPSQRESAAKQFIAEALEGEENLSLVSVDISESGQGELSLFMCFDYNGESVKAQTTI